jgi:hypothetical protein
MDRTNKELADAFSFSGGFLLPRDPDPLKLVTFIPVLIFMPP